MTQVFRALFVILGAFCTTFAFGAAQVEPVPGAGVLESRIELDGPMLFDITNPIGSIEIEPQFEDAGWVVSIVARTVSGSSENPILLIYGEDDFRKRIFRIDVQSGQATSNDPRSVALTVRIPQQLLFHLRARTLTLQRSRLPIGSGDIRMRGFSEVHPTISDNRFITLFSEYGNIVSDRNRADLGIHLISPNGQISASGNFTSADSSLHAQSPGFITIAGHEGAIIAEGITGDVTIAGARSFGKPTAAAASTHNGNITFIETANVDISSVSRSGNISIIGAGRHVLALSEDGDIFLENPFAESQTAEAVNGTVSNRSEIPLCERFLGLTPQKRSWTDREFFGGKQ